ncbi:hypothetical protein BN938_2265 [Mucinivorans hirudinis]|uniref:Uncharacterized protein n=1 Tax=Mucinivorans hirudinis TaxID=1433126 RepID=A0A060R9U1_9BACT|nr:hypothetical protein BN938_2265 [Mucinivorans hirudinis]
MTRAVVSVLKFNFADAWEYNKLIIFVFPVLLYLWARWIHQIFKKL